MAQSNNRFSYGGALGGLVAADETIQKELTSRLDNIQKAITNADMALDLNLAQKYREAGSKADLAQKQAEARKKAVDANVAERTEDSVVEKAAVDVEHTRALTDASGAQAEHSRALTAEVAPNARSARNLQGAQAGQAAANTARLNQETSMAMDYFNLKRDEVDARVRQVDASVSHQATLLDLRADEIAVAQQNAKTAEERAATDARLADIQKRRQDLATLMSVAENERTWAQARAFHASAAADAAKIGAQNSQGAATGLTGEKLRTKLGYDNPESFAGSLVHEIIASTPGWDILVPGTEGETTGRVGGFMPFTGTTGADEPEAVKLRTVARDRVKDALHRYEQLASTGQVGVLAAQDLKRVLGNSFLAAYPAPKDLVERTPVSEAYEGAHNAGLASLRSKIMNSKSPAEKAQLGQAYSNMVVSSVRSLQEKELPIPLDLLFEFSLIQAQVR